MAAHLVPLSVCFLSRSGIVSQRLDISSEFSHLLVTRNSSFLGTKPRFDAFATLHWSRIPERINSEVAAMVCLCCTVWLRLRLTWMNWFMSLICLAINCWTSLVSARCINCLELLTTRSPVICLSSTIKDTRYAPCSLQQFMRSDSLLRLWRYINLLLTCSEQVVPRIFPSRYSVIVIYSSISATMLPWSS